MNMSIRRLRRCCAVRKALCRYRLTVDGCACASLWIELPSRFLATSARLTECLSAATPVETLACNFALGKDTLRHCVSTPWDRLGLRRHRYIDDVEFGAGAAVTRRL